MRLLRVLAAALLLSNLAVPSGAAQDGAWQALDDRVMALYEAGSLPQAIAAGQEALKAASSPRQTGRSLDRLGFLYYTSGDLAQGERFLRQSLELRDASFGTDSLDDAESANDLAMLLRDLRRMDEARNLATRSVETRERRLGESALPLAESLNTLGTVLGLAGDYATAVTQFERAAAIHEREPAAARATEEYGTLCVNLAGTYQRLGRYADAESTFVKGLDALRIKPGVGHPAYAVSELAYAALEVDLGRYTEADRLYDEGGRLLGAELGEQHPLYATFLNNRGLFYQTIGNLPAADADYQRSLALKRQLYGPDSALAVSTLRNLATLTLRRDPRAGERLLSETAAAYARMANAPPFDYASVLVGLARAQRVRGAAADAVATAARAIALARSGLGAQHPLVAAATREAGLANAAAGDPVLAGQQLQDAVAIAVQAHGPDHPDVAGYLDALGDFDVDRRDFAAAQVLYERSLDIQDRYWGQVLEIGSEGFKAASLAEIGDPVPRLIRFMNAAGTAEARALAFAAVTRRSGRILEEMRSWRSGLTDSQSPLIQRQLAEWRAVVGCMASLSVAVEYRELKPGLAGSCTLKGSDLAGRYERLLADLRSKWTPAAGTAAVRAIADLRGRAEQIENTLARATAGATPAALRPRTADLRRRLGAAETLVAFTAYDAGDAGAERRRYGAFVLNRQGAIRWCDLGPAESIDRAVADLSAAARDWGQSSAAGEVRPAQVSARTAQAALELLSARVWEPIAPLVDRRSTELRIAPDGALYLVPFAAVVSGGQPLIDRYVISYLTAGRDLVSASPARRHGAAVVVVSPGGGTGAPGAASPAGWTPGTLARLAAADAEAADIRQTIPGLSVMSGSAATERRLKTLRAPILLHIIGHGVVHDNGPCTADCEGGRIIDPSVSVMTRAAIVLEEAYGRAQSSDDGLLTPLELENMDLRGTELLVLSQCQMAGGEPSIGEGVYGMRRAAAIAGARSFMAPLWNVEDDEERRLMRDFYARLAAGESRADALRHAQLALRRAGTTSFLEWAPMILTGEPSRLPASMFGRTSSTAVPR